MPSERVGLTQHCELGKEMPGRASGCQQQRGFAQPPWGDIAHREEQKVRTGVSVTSVIVIYAAQLKTREGDSQLITAFETLMC